MTTNTTETAVEQEIKLTYGERTMLTLEEFFNCGNTPYAARTGLPIPSEFWEWRKENKLRAGVLNKAGVSLCKTDAGWVADLSAVSADTLDEARDNGIKWQRTEKELNDRANLYLRQCDRIKYQPGGQFGG